MKDRADQKGQFMVPLDVQDGADDIPMKAARAGQNDLAATGILVVGWLLDENPIGCGVVVCSLWCCECKVHC